MDFRIDDMPKTRGSVASMLADDDLRELMSVYGDGVLASFGVDVRQKPSLFNANVVRSAKGFLAEYGKDAKRIVNVLYSPPYSGRFKGGVVGPEIFSKGKRWLANSILLAIGD